MSLNATFVLWLKILVLLEFVIKEHNDDIEQLRGSETVTKLEFPNNKEITDEKLQSILPSLTNLTVLIAQNSNLSSFNFIDSSSKCYRNFD